MSALDPQPGEKFIHSTFGGGCSVRIIKRGIRKGWGDAVWFYLDFFDPLPRSKLRRITALRNWPQFAKDLTQPTHPAAGEE